MKSDLFVFPPAAEEGPLLWARVAANGGRVEFGRVEAGAQARGLNGVDRVVLVAPGVEVAAREIALPARSDRQARAAAAFAIEDDLAEPVDAVEVALGRRRADSPRRAVAAASKARLAAWREAAETAGLALDHITPDYAALPAGPGEAAVVDLGDIVLARAGDAGFSVEAEHAPALIAAFLEGRALSTLRAWSDRPDALLGGWARGDCAVEVEPGVDDTGYARLLLRGLSEGLGVDFAGRGRGWSAGALDLAVLRAPAALALAAALAYIASMVVETQALERRADAARAQAAEALQAAFPDIERVVNPRAQLRARLASGGASHGDLFLSLSALVSQALVDVEGVEVEAVRFDRSAPALEVSIVYRDYADVESFAAALEARGGALEEGGARQRGAYFAGDVVVRAR